MFRKISLTLAVLALAWSLAGAAWGQYQCTPAETKTIESLSFQQVSKNRAKHIICGEMKGGDISGGHYGRPWNNNAHTQFPANWTIADILSIANQVAAEKNPEGWWRSGNGLYTKEIFVTLKDKTVPIKIVVDEDYKVITAYPTAYVQ